MEREKRVTAQTKRIANLPAWRWIQREKPLRWAAAIGIEAPAMNPAMQALAWKAKTAAFRSRIGSIAAGLEGSVMPGRWTGVRSGVSLPATNQTAKSKVAATVS